MSSSPAKPLPGRVDRLVRACARAAAAAQRLPSNSADSGEGARKKAAKGRRGADIDLSSGDGDAESFAFRAAADGSFARGASQCARDSAAALVDVLVPGAVLWAAQANSLGSSSAVSEAREDVLFAGATAGQSPLIPLVLRARDPSDPGVRELGEQVGEAGAALLAQVGSYLDAAAGLTSPDSSALASTGSGVVSSGASPRGSAMGAQQQQPQQQRGRAGARAGGSVFRDTNISRPQQRFTTPVDNSSAPFVPRVGLGLGGRLDAKEVKLHATKAAALPQRLQSAPLAPTTTTTTTAVEKKAGARARAALREPLLDDDDLKNHLAALGVDTSRPAAAEEEEEEGEEGEDSAPHPYAAEIRALAWTPWHTAPREPQRYKPLEETKLTFVDTLEQLQALLNTLMELPFASDPVLAVDLEHHSYRSFLGFVCLMQLSTRSEDWIVDTIALREHVGMLNAVFADPRILKVLHGADSDILWLQRDFGIYVVNLFDTGQATRVLDKPRNALAWLLEQYCSVRAQKQHQVGVLFIFCPPSCFFSSSSSMGMIF
jgi:3'-5' exonuclease